MLDSPLRLQSVPLTAKHMKKKHVLKMACVVSRGEQEDRGETTERQVEIHSDA